METEVKVDRPVYVLKLRPLPGVDAIKALRAVLKSLLRRHGMQALECREETKREGAD
jgi:hypothetical protein